MSRNTAIGYIVILVGAGLVIAGTIISLKNPWIAGLLFPGAAAIVVGRWIVKNLK